MTAEEAIKELQYQEDMRAKGVNYQVNNLVISMAIKALEKQIPKKPRITIGKYRVENSDEHLTCNFTHCPHCFEIPELDYFESLIDLGTQCCRHCGQKIDWSNEDDKL